MTAGHRHHVHTVSVLAICYLGMLAGTAHASIEIPDTKLWRAVFASDFSDVEVRDQYNQVVVDRFALTE
ncbi:MAG: hypothetical protein LBE64_23570 [Acinetobacter pittii]|nr:hypothetical protein [Acinetobacter pittii]